MSLRVLGAKEWRWPLLFGFGLGLLVMTGFLPASRAIFRLSPWAPRDPATARMIEMACFPLLAFLFAVTTPMRRPLHPKPFLELAQTLLVPALIALAFGAVNPLPNISQTWRAGGQTTLAWYLIFIPFGEEFLFRGWLYGIIDWLWPEKMLTATNPLPVAVWVTALAFGTWHFQNLPFDPLPLVLLQVAYTLCSGLWLGYLRWRSGGVLLPVLAHATLNLASGLL